MHIINTLHAGGAELHLLTLCRHLKAAGLSVIVVCLKNIEDDARPLRPEFEQEGIEVVELNAPSRFDFSYLPDCLGLIRQEKPDIVHTHLPRADIAGATHIISGSRVPWVCSVHGIYSEHWSGSWALPLLDWAWRRADQIVAISSAVRDWLVDEQGQHATKVRVVHYGIDAEAFSAGSSELRDAMKLGKCPVVGMVGRLEEGKAYEVLIRAMPGILRVHPDTKLLIAGHDTWGYRGVLQGLIEELHLQQSVCLVGFQDDIPAFLRTLDVFAFPSRTEGFGQAVVEAMAAGRPVIVRDMPPLTEIVTEEVNGRLVSGEAPEEWANAVLHYLENPEDARLTGVRAQSSVSQRFNATRMARETVGLYESLLFSR